MIITYSSDGVISFYLFSRWVSFISVPESGRHPDSRAFYLKSREEEPEPREDRSGQSTLPQRNKPVFCYTVELLCFVFVAVTVAKLSLT